MFHHTQTPHLENVGTGGWFGVEEDLCSIKWSRVLGKTLYMVGTSFIYAPTACHASPVCVAPGTGSILLLAAAHSSSFSPQTQARPCLQTPQLQAQAQSPLCHLHSEEPANHLSPHSPEITVPGTALPHYWDPPSAWSSSLRKESSSRPYTAPTMPSRGVQFYIHSFHGLLTER